MKRHPLTGRRFGATALAVAVSLICAPAAAQDATSSEEALEEIVASYEKETEEAVQVMTTLLEPLVILFMGIVVGFIVIAMLLPVFQINIMVR